MEKYKSRNKKKKPKQSKTAEDSAKGVVTSAGENHIAKNGQGGTTKDVEKAEVVQDEPVSVVGSVTLAGENHVAWNEQGGTSKDTENSEIKDEPVSVVGSGQGRCFPSESDFASLEDRNRHLLEERNMCLLKEELLEEEFRQLREGRDMSMQKEARLEEIVKKMEGERESWLQKEASLLEQIKHLQNENGRHVLKEALLDEEFSQLQKGKVMSMQKAVNLEQNIAELHQENEVLMQKEARLEERVKQMEGERESRLQKENSNKETIDFLNGDISRLQMQLIGCEKCELSVIKKVAELEQLRDNLLQEKQLMAQTISGLETQILNLERTAAVSSSTDGKMHTVGNGHLTSEIEAAYALIEKLITENADLVEKMDALYAELKYNGRRKLENHDDSSSGTIESASVGLSSDVSLVMEEEVETPENGPSANEAGTMNLASGEITKVGEHDDKGATEHREIVPNSLDASDLDEIVQISLDENESQTTGSEAVYEDEKTEVPISDAPLIGAPFRIISFMARYVSGADLVEKNSESGG